MGKSLLPVFLLLMEIAMDEKWKDIPGYEGEYQASTLGRIKSVERRVRGEHWKTHREFYRTVPERILKPGRYCKSGHVSVVLRHGSNGTPVHQLVMRTFVGETPSGMEILHGNGNPEDNRLENLRFGTRRENILDVFKQGGRWRKLSIEDVVYIRFASRCGFSDKSLAEEFKVSKYTIAEIRKGNIYKWIT